jgi:hypothetical protein
MRSKKAAKCLKTNNPAKPLDFAPNDFNGLRPDSRNHSFRLAKDAFRFCCFWASWATKTQPAKSAAFGWNRHRVHRQGTDETWIARFARDDDPGSTQMALRGPQPEVSGMRAKKRKSCAKEQLSL